MTLKKHFLWNSVLFRSVSNLGIGYFATHGIPGKAHFFHRIMKTVADLFRRIFSERTFGGNPNLSMWETIGTDVSWCMYERQWPGWWLNGAEETHTSVCVHSHWIFPFIYSCRLCGCCHPCHLFWYLFSLFLTLLDSAGVFPVKSSGISFHKVFLTLFWLCGRCQPCRLIWYFLPIVLLSPFDSAGIVTLVNSLDISFQ